MPPDGGQARLSVDKLVALGEPESVPALKKATLAMPFRIDLPYLPLEVHAWTGFLDRSNILNSAKADDSATGCRPVAQPKRRDSKSHPVTSPSTLARLSCPVGTPISGRSGYLGGAQDLLCCALSATAQVPLLMIRRYGSAGRLAAAWLPRYGRGCRPGSSGSASRPRDPRRAPGHRCGVGARLRTVGMR
jgi:hypothetical protein